MQQCIRTAAARGLQSARGVTRRKADAEAEARRPRLCSATAGPPTASTITCASFGGAQLRTCTEGCSSRCTGRDRRRPSSGPASPAGGVPGPPSARSCDNSPTPPLPPAPAASRAAASPLPRWLRLLPAAGPAAPRGLGPPRCGEAVLEPPGLLPPPGLLGMLHVHQHAQQRISRLSRLIGGNTQQAAMQQQSLLLDSLSKAAGQTDLVRCPPAGSAARDAAGQGVARGGGVAHILHPHLQVQLLLPAVAGCLDGRGGRMFLPLQTQPPCI